MPGQEVLILIREKSGNILLSNLRPIAYSNQYFNIIIWFVYVGFTYMKPFCSENRRKSFNLWNIHYDIYLGLELANKNIFTESFTVQY